MGIRERARLDGKIRYFTGKACKKGHFSDRLVSTGKCIACCRVEDKKYKRLKKYGIRLNEYSDLLWKQNGKCAICKENEIIISAQSGKIISLSVDHCHVTGKIRGLLCNQCNIGIGNLKHSPDLLRAAALYCEKA